MPNPNQHGGAAGSGAKPPPRPAPQPRNLLDLLLTIESFYSTPELERAIAELKDDPVGGIPAGRAALSDHFQQLLFNGAASSAVGAFDKLTAKVSDLEDRVSLFLSRVSAEDLETFLVPGALKSRYEEEHPEEKKAIAQYIVREERFFPKNQTVRVFIQASVTSIHLAKELSRVRLRPGCLFVTNSIVLPIILLQGNAHVSVYTLCGTEYDNRCGGWLPRCDDVGAHSYLEDLFTRDTAQLQDAYITPMAVNCADGELLFTRIELQSLIEVAAQHAPRLIIMTLSSRLLKSMDDPAINALQMHNQLYRLKLDLQRFRPLMVIAHDLKEPLRDDEFRSRIGKLLELGFEIHWQGPDRQWRVLRRSEGSDGGEPNEP